MTQHLDALYLRRSHEAVRLANARSESERAIRTVWIAQIDKEIAAENSFTDETPDMTDDELMAALQA